MLIRKIAFLFLVVFTTVLVGACKKDSALKASKAECDDACTHATALNRGKRDSFAKKCPALCLSKEWTVGDTRCVNDAKTYDEAQNCGVVAKAMLDLKEGKGSTKRKARRHRRSKKKHNNAAAPTATAAAPADPSAKPAAGGEADGEDDGEDE